MSFFASSFVTLRHLGLCSFHNHRKMLFFQARHLWFNGIQKGNHHITTDISGSESSNKRYVACPKLPSCNMVSGCDVKNRSDLLALGRSSIHASRNHFWGLHLSSRVKGL